MALTPDRQFTEAIERSRHALVTFRSAWTTDAVASALALRRILEKRGKKADIVVENFNPPAALGFLPGIADIKPEFRQLRRFTIELDISKIAVDELAYDHDGQKLRIHVAPKSGMYEAGHVTTAPGAFKYDLIITLDTPDYASLGKLYRDNTELFFAHPTVNIDHDPANEHYGNVNLVDLTATSTAEIVYRQFLGADAPFLDEDTATLLLAGMMAKTKSFRGAAVTPRTLSTASELMAAGARRDQIVDQLYRTRSIPTLKIWGRALARLKFDPITKLAWTVLVRQDFVHAGAKEDRLSDVIEELILSAPEADVVAVLYEQESTTEPGRTAGVCALVSSERHGDALQLMAQLKPEGNRRLARICLTNMSIMDAEQRVKEVVAAALGKATQREKALAANPA